MKKRVRIAILALSLFSFVCIGCGNNGNGDANAEVNSENANNSVNSCELTEEDITVSLSTDKDSYEEGETVHYVLTITNNNPDYTISGKKFNYTNKGLVAKSDDSMPNFFDNIRSGESVTLEGDLVGGNSGSPGNTSATSGTDVVNFRPYLQINYGGQEAMVRCVLNLKLIMVVQQFGDKEMINKSACCHDPSIFKDKDGTYYVFGTHISASSSKDLFDWTECNDEFKNALSKETRDQIRQWNKDNTVDWNSYLWAPDILYSEQMGKYLIYLSANGDDWKSNIVLLTADEVMGPYEYAGSIVYGGFDETNYKETDVPKVLGDGELPERYLINGVGNKKWGDKFPNCIDPCAFYDAEGNLWMTYGSWSGGIFILALDEKTGLRDYSVTYETEKHSDAYFGKLIAGGNYVTGEGSYSSESATITIFSSLMAILRRRAATTSECSDQKSLMDLMWMKLVIHHSMTPIRSM